MREKDTLIEEYRKEIDSRKREEKRTFGIMKSEVERDHFLMKEDLVEGIKLIDKENSLLSKEVYDVNKRF